jgi:hypothetical protein
MSGHDERQPVNLTEELIDSKSMRENVLMHTNTWKERKTHLKRDKWLLELRETTATLGEHGNVVPVVFNPDPRTTEQIRDCITFIESECDIMQYEIRFLTHVYNARSGKAAHITMAAEAMKQLHVLRVDALEKITEADLLDDTKVIAVLESSEGEPSIHKNGGGVKAIADRYMHRYTWETTVLALCRAGKYY